MKSLPQPFWAIILASFGVTVALCCLFHPNSDNSVTLAVLAVSANLVSGALGAFAGHATANNNPVSNVTMGNDRGTIISNDAK